MTIISGLQLAVCSDFMLEYRFKRMNNQSAMKYYEIQMQNFRQTVQEVINAKVDAWIIAGNLFGCDKPKNTTLAVIINEFQKLEEKNIPIFILPGHHDSPLGILNDQSVHYILEKISNVIILRNNPVKSSDTNKQEPYVAVEINGTKIHFYSNPNVFSPPDISKLNLIKKNGELNFLILSDLTAFRRDKRIIIDKLKNSLKQNKFDLFLYGGHRDEAIKSIKNGSLPSIFCPAIHPTQFDYLEPEQQGLKLITIENGKIQKENIIPILKIQMQQLLFDVNSITAVNLDKNLKAILIQNAKKSQILQIKLMGRLSKDEYHFIKKHQIVETGQKQHHYFELKDDIELVLPELAENKDKKEAIGVISEINNIINKKIAEIQNSSEINDNVQEMSDLYMKTLKKIENDYSNIGDEN